VRSGQHSHTSLVLCSLSNTNQTAEFREWGAVTRGLTGVRYCAAKVA